LLDSGHSNTPRLLDRVLEQSARNTIAAQGASKDGAGLSAEQRVIAERYWSCAERFGKDAENLVLSEMPTILSAELDLETGEVKGIEFCYPQLFWQALRDVGAEK